MQGCPGVFLFTGVQVRDKGVFLRWLFGAWCFSFLVVVPVVADEVSGRDAKAERELAELYGDRVGDWKGREPVKPKAAAKVPATQVKPQTRESRPVVAATPETSAGTTPSQAEGARDTGEAVAGAPEARREEGAYTAVPSRLPSAMQAGKPDTEGATSQATGKKPGGTGKEVRLGHVVVDKDGKVDDVKTLAAFRKAAKKGDAGAQFNLGLAYEHGWGLKADLKEAAQWYARASQQGHAGAQLNLGLMFYQGRGVDKDMKLGVAHFEKAAAHGNAMAQFNLGNVYLNGEGVTRSESIALAWFRKSADQGYMVAQFMLGRLYMQGDGVAQNPEEAVRWYERAAEQGLLDAQAAMGLAYEKGYGVKENRKEALRWYGLAAAQGHKGAIAHMNKLNM